jgi:DNA uptake protein ComE-like DNA-binding protein
MRKFVLITAFILAATPAVAQGTMAPSATTGARPAGTPAAQLVDINSATKEQLEPLKGIGPVRAEAIIKGRPYKGKDELWQKNIISKNLYEGIKDEIIAKQ